MHNEAMKSWKVWYIVHTHTIVHVLQKKSVTTVHQRPRNGVSTASMSSVSDGTTRFGTVTDNNATRQGAGGSGVGTGGSTGGARGSGRGGTSGTTGLTEDCDSCVNGTGADHVSTPATGRSSGDSASTGTVTTSERTSSTSELLLEDQTHVLLPRKVAVNNMQIRILKERIQGYGKKGLFKKCKFIACEEGLQQVMAKLALIFQIPQQKRQAFTAQFKKTVMDSLNAKRAFCEQQGGKIVLSKYNVLLLTRLLLDYHTPHNSYYYLFLINLLPPLYRLSY